MMLLFMPLHSCLLLHAKHLLDAVAELIKELQFIDLFLLLVLVVVFFFTVGLVHHLESLGSLDQTFI